MIGIRFAIQRNTTTAKVMKAIVTQTSIHERLLQEGRIQAKLYHPSIVRVHDVLETVRAAGLADAVVRKRRMLERAD